MRFRRRGWCCSILVPAEITNSRETGMMGKVLLATAALTVVLQIVARELAPKGLFGFGDTGFFRAVYFVGADALVAAVIAIIAVILGGKGSVSPWITVTTIALAVLTFLFFLAAFFV